MDRPAEIATERVRTALRAWAGGDLHVRQIALLVGLPVDKRLYNAVGYLLRKGVIRRVGRGVYMIVS